MIDCDGETKGEGGGGGERGEISPRTYMIPCRTIFDLGTVKPTANCEQNYINKALGRLGKAVPGMKWPVS